MISEDLSAHRKVWFQGVKMKKLLILLLVSSLLFCQYSTEGAPGSMPEKMDGVLVVEKSAPERVSVDEEFQVVIGISNPTSSDVEVWVKEYLSNVEPIEPIPEKTVIEDESMLAATPPKLTWEIVVPAGGETSVEYTVKPKTVGTLSIGPTSVRAGSNEFFSNSVLVKVGCSPSPTCDESIGETPLTCPSKCAPVEGNITPSEAPELEIIPSEDYVPPEEPEMAPPDEEDLFGKQIQMAIIILVILAIAIGLYLSFKK